jgi:5-deoxy-glucuronate isomerase
MGNFASELELTNGINRVDLSESNFRFIKEFSVLKLQGDKKYVFEESPYETGLLVLEGGCEIKINGQIEKILGSRKDVFSGQPTAAYIPIHTKFTLKSQSASIGLCRAECKEKTEPAIIRPSQVKEMAVGKDNWARKVRMIIGPDSPSVNMLVGETINPPGNWSGTPPHKHEAKIFQKESLHEELYYFKTEKPQGWGIERLYSPDRNINELIYLKENTVTFMPWGYHQIVAGPGYALYYLFFLAGEGKNLSGCEDPDHCWIKQ